MLGVTAGDAKTQLSQLLDHLPDNYVGAQMAGHFGISAQTFHQLQQNRGRERAAEADSLRRQNASGINFDEFSKKSVELTNDLDKLRNEFGILGVTIANDFIGPVDHAVNEIESLVEQFVAFNKTTGGTASGILGIVAALTTLLGLKASAGWLLGLFSGDAAAATAGGAVGGGILGRLGLAGAALLADWEIVKPQPAGEGEDEAARRRKLAAQGLDPNGEGPGVPVVAAGGPKSVKHTSCSG